MAWSKLARAVGIAALISLASTAGFLALPEKITQPERPSYALPAELSSATKHEVQAYATRWKNLAVISIISLDLNHNTRTTLYNVVSNTAVRERMAVYKQERSNGAEYGKVTPIYTRSRTHNEDMTRLMRGSFSCTAGAASFFAELYDLQDLIVTSCRVPIDPSVGRVVGYLAVHFITPPLSKDQIKQIETDTKVLATTIYFNEINPR